MAQYTFTRDYRSGFGTYAKGDTADFDDDTAQWLNRDEPGCLTATKAEHVETRAVEAAPADRMIHTAKKRSHDEGAMSSADSKLVKP